MPQLDAGTKEAIPSLVTLTKIAQVMKVVYADKEFVSSRPGLMHRFVRFAYEISKDNCFEGNTFANLVLHPSYSVVEHCDEANDYKLRQTLICNEICEKDGIYIRGSQIGYLRNSCAMAMHRRAACQEAVNNVTRFIQNAMPHQLPPIDPRAHHLNAGSEGIVVLVDDKKKKLHGISLLCKATIDKQVTYISPLASDVRSLAEKRGLHLKSQLEICIIILYLNNTILLSFVLKMLLYCNQITPSKSMGYFGLVLYMMKQLSPGGNFTAGPKPRSANRTNGVIHMGRVEESLSYLLHICQESRQSGSSCHELPESQVWERFLSYTKGIEKNCYRAGDFSSQHLVHLLVDLGLLLPATLKKCAKYSLQSSSHKKREDPKPGKKASLNRNPKMREYLDAGASRDNRGRADRVLVAATEHLNHCQILGPGRTLHKNHTEGGGCEGNRKFTPYDPLGIGEYLLDVSGNGTLFKHTVTIEEDSTNYKVLSEPAAPLVDNASPYIGPFFSTVSPRPRKRSANPSVLPRGMSAIKTIIQVGKDDGSNSTGFLMHHIDTSIVSSKIEWLRFLFAESRNKPNPLEHVLSSIESDHSLMREIWGATYSPEITTSQHRSTVEQLCASIETNYGVAVTSTTQENRTNVVSDEPDVSDTEDKDNDSSDSGELTPASGQKALRISIKMPRKKKLSSKQDMPPTEAALLDDLSIGSWDLTQEDDFIFQYSNSFQQLPDKSRLKDILTDTASGITTANKLFHLSKKGDCCQLVEISSLLTLVNGAMNKGYPADKQAPDLRRGSIITQNIKPGQWTCNLSCFPPSYFQPGYCTLCDTVADVLHGVKSQFAADRPFVWVFTSRELAVRHVLLSLFLTTKSKAYYRSTQRNCLKKHGTSPQKEGQTKRKKERLTIFHSSFDESDWYFATLSVGTKFWIVLVDQHFLDSKITERENLVREGRAQFLNANAKKRKVVEPSEETTKAWNRVKFLLVLS